ncbi:tRNA threonylcarbamoyladenosine dehydratase [Phocaeicola oris]|uniref:tRNA threonylcarbamoyladenosine dehydratase n=1 Tax=Phocaeicola oris TaxID=2896850 RepID=UPI00234F0E5C|nr:tRNA threonylcarbamoyladenosine dehydratase [Phocaeicola oris]MCE2616836.1 tRNA threonylcarbamoyladenosine dehydratase [Phocaeicola oris]
MSEKDILRRTELLLGEKMMEKVAGTRVIIFGVGGVGSWCADSLIRSGVAHLTIVDSDSVCVTNINRQMMATTKTVGQVKVNALRDRLLDINPAADVLAIQKIYTEETMDEFNLDGYDYVIDAIDSLKDKALLIMNATKSKAKLFASMGAALKMDPTRIHVTEFWKVQGDPLAAALRRKFKHNKMFPRKKFQCVYSDELMKNHGVDKSRETDTCLLPKAQINGSVVHITAVFGFMLAGLVMNDIWNKYKKNI